MALSMNITFENSEELMELTANISKKLSNCKKQSNSSMNLKLKFQLPRNEFCASIVQHFLPIRKVCFFGYKFVKNCLIDLKAGRKKSLKFEDVCKIADALDVSLDEFR